MFGIRHRENLLTTFNLEISANETNWNLIAELGFTPTVPVVINVVVNTGVLIDSSAPGTAAMNLNGLPSGSTINLDNNGYVLGRGGGGGDGGSVGVGSVGIAGGHAIAGPGTGNTLNITNALGNIWGGGGGGGGGGAAEDFIDGPAEPDWGPGGGGGGGAGGGPGGIGGEDVGIENPGGTGTNGNAGTSGIGGTGGTGGVGGVVIVENATGGTGGTGGAYGAAGAAGASGMFGDTNSAGGAAGAAGKAIDLGGGSHSFVSGGGAPNVKGAVS